MQTTIIQTARNEERSPVQWRFPIRPKTVILTILAVLGIWRAFSLVPQPLDSANTLRPLLYRLYLVFVGRYTRFDDAVQAWETYRVALLILPAILAALNFWLDFRPPVHLSRWASRIAKLLRSRALFIASILAVLLLAYFPIVLMSERNVDESQLITIAQKLHYDWFFFRGSDGGTSGPLNSYPLLLPALFGFSPDYASTRVIEILLIWLALFFVYKTAAIIAPERIARLAILPGVCYFASLKFWDLIHFSTEHVPLFLTAVSAYLTIRFIAEPAFRVRGALLLGFTGSCAFLSKLQVVPIIAAGFGVVLIYEALKTRSWKAVCRLTLLYLAGLASLLFVNVVLCAWFGILGDFYRSYVLANKSYVGELPNPFTYAPAFLSFLLYPFDFRMHVNAFVILAGIFSFYRFCVSIRRESTGLEIATAFTVATAICAVLLFWHGLPVNSSGAAVVWAGLAAALVCVFASFWQQRFIPRLSVWLGLTSIAMLYTGVAAVYLANRFFTHYMLLLIVPMTLGAAALLLAGSEGSDRGIAVWLNSGFVAGCIVYSLVTSAQIIYKDGLLLLGYDLTEISPSIASQDGLFVRALTSRDPRVVIWGWDAKLHLESGTISATRDSNVRNLFDAPDEIKAYYRRRFLKDFLAAPPPLFIEVVGPEAFYMKDRNVYGYETVPEVRSAVEARYQDLGTFSHRRYLIRKDLFPGVPDALRATCHRDSAACYSALEVSDAPVRQPPLPASAPFTVTLDFEPEGAQTDFATVLSDATDPESFKGLQIQNAGPNWYRVVLGLGDRWAFSQSFPALPGSLNRVVITLRGNTAGIQYNGTALQTLALSRPFANSGGNVLLRSWIGKRPFKGRILLYNVWK